MFNNCTCKSYLIDLVLVDILCCTVDCVLSQERMSLDSPRSGSGVRAPSLLQRSSSVASSTYTDGFSDGYFSEVFEGEEMDDINSSLTPLSDTLTTLINAPFANSPSPSTPTSKVCPSMNLGILNLPVI